MARVLRVNPVKRTINMFFGCCKQKGQLTKSSIDIDKAIIQAVLANDAKSRKDFAR